MIDDSSEPMPPNMYGGGGAPGSLRPPTMIERHVNNASPMLARQRSMGAPYGQPPMQPAFDHDGYPLGPGAGFPPDNGYPTAAGYGAPAPMPMHYGGGPADEYIFQAGPMPPAPHGNPFGAPYEHPMPSPVSSQVPSYPSHVHVTEPQAALTRRPSAPARQGSLGGAGAEDAYADFARASVTPFQAQQYAEINHKLNTPSLRAISEAQHMPAPPPAVVAPGQPLQRASPPPGVQAKRPDTVYSAIYDEEDAYGGI
jgi:hypothetical protein